MVAVPLRGRPLFGFWPSVSVFSAFRFVEASTAPLSRTPADLVIDTKSWYAALYGFMSRTALLMSSFDIAFSMIAR